MSRARKIVSWELGIFTALLVCCAGYAAWRGRQLAILERIELNGGRVLLAASTPNYIHPLSQAGFRERFFGQTNFVTVRGLPLPADDLKWLVRCGVEFLDFEPGVELPPGAYSILARSRHLWSLGFSGQPLDVENLAQLATIARLGKLTIQGAHLRREHIEQIASIRNLVQLQLVGCEIEPGALEPIKLAKLIRLQLDESQLSDDDLQFVAAIPTLRVLLLVRTSITDAGITHLRGAGVWYLDLRGTRLTQAAVDDLMTLTQIKGMSVSGSISPESALTLRRQLPNAKISQVGEPY